MTTEKVLPQRCGRIRVTAGRQVTSGRYTRITEVKEGEAAFNTKTVDVMVYFSPTMEDTLKKALVSTIIYP